MSQMFDKIRVGSTKRSTFDLSHHQVTTSDFGYIIPICYRDMVPNDDFVVKPYIFTRLAPMAVPTYGRITCRVHHFFVPYRILYPQWNSFIIQDKNNHTVPPYFTVTTLKSALATDPQFSSESGLTLKRGTFGRLMSNLGLNPLHINTDSLSGDERISAFPFLAYYRIWLDYFADTNIYDHPALVEQLNSVIDGGGSMAAATWLLYTRNSCYKKDYFTTAKLNPQAGSDPSLVGVDLASSSLNPGLVSSAAKNTLRSYQGKVAIGDNTNVFNSPNANSKIGQFTIEALRAANSLQNWLERSNFVGTKIINQILAHFGISPTPERLDMAEFIGGSSFPIQIGDVTSTSPNYSSTSSLANFGLGEQAGKGVGAGSGDSVRYHAKEHGIFMSVMSILPDTGYYQGISRMWQKGVNGDALDFFTPEFENLGYQEMLNKEVFVPLDSSTYSDYDGNGIFGYTPRYSEYKFHNDVLAGDFVGGPSSAVTGGSMNSWHLFRTLNYTTSSPLALNENFVECDNHNNNFDRIFQVTNNEFDHFYFNIDMDVKATRPMDGFSAPSLDTNRSEDGNTIELPYGGTRL